VLSALKEGLLHRDWSSDTVALQYTTVSTILRLLLFNGLRIIRGPQLTKNDTDWLDHVSYLCSLTPARRSGCPIRRLPVPTRQ